MNADTFGGVGRNFIIFPQNVRRGQRPAVTKLHRPSGEMPQGGALNVGFRFPPAPLGLGALEVVVVSDHDLRRPCPCGAF